MKKYLVTEEQFKACFSQPPPMIGQAIPPNARVLTRDQFEAAFWAMRERVGKPAIKLATFKELADELFGKEDDNATEKR